MIINVKVKTNCSKEKIIEQDDYLKVELKNKAEKGEANKELVNLLSKHYGKRVRIIKGLKSKNKVIEV